LGRLNSFRRAVEEKPYDPLQWYYHAMAKLGASDVDGYRRVCAEMRGRFEKTKDRATAARVVFTCVVAPDGAVDGAELVRLAKLAVGYERALASACYRHGEYERAILLYQQKGQRFPLRGVDLLFLAMAQHQLGRHAEARETFEKAATWFDRPAGDSWSWCDLVEVRQLRKEAETLLQGK
jgi:tetratricopeptide (TPR) repeat protein